MSAAVWIEKSRLPWNRLQRQSCYSLFHYTVGSSKILTVNNTAIKYLSLATVVFFAPQNDEPVRMPREKAKSKEVRFKID